MLQVAHSEATLTVERGRELAYYAHKRQYNLNTSTLRSYAISNNVNYANDALHNAIVTDID